MPAASDQESVCGKASANSRGRAKDATEKGSYSICGKKAGIVLVELCDTKI
jgi:hypothetical protein